MSVCFWFKQKTAYEMRISDWSSDVCSSDLQSSARRVRHRRGQIMVHLQPFTVNGTKTSVLVPAYTHERGAPTGDDGADIPSSTSRKELAARTRSIPSTASRRLVLVFDQQRCRPVGDPFQEIGRASCRERVCQYV